MEVNIAKMSFEQILLKIHKLNLKLFVTKWK